MQACGNRLNVRTVAEILLKDEGLLRFWKGAHVMASGCVPAHASYFLFYEHLKIYFGLDHSEFNLVKTACIGSSTTFVHDFFITPADGKSLSFSYFFSCEVKTLAMQTYDSNLSHQKYFKRRWI